MTNTETVAATKFSFEIADSNELLVQFLSECSDTCEMHKVDPHNKELNRLMRNRFVKLTKIANILRRPMIRTSIYNDRPGVITQDDRPSDECECEFDAYDDGDTEESCHFLRRCLVCRHTFYSPHCVHEGPAEFRCTNCS